LGLAHRARRHPRAPSDALGRRRPALPRSFGHGARRRRPDQPAKFSATADGTHPNLRRILVDLVDEYARHVGHVDLFREATDGLVGEAPPASAN